MSYFSSFRGAPLGASPESILPMVVMDSGLDAEPVIGPANGRTRWLGRDDVELLTHTLCIVTESLGPFLMVW